MGFGVFNLARRSFPSLLTDRFFVRGKYGAMVSWCGEVQANSIRFDESTAFLCRSAWPFLNADGSCVFFRDGYRKEQKTKTAGAWCLVLCILYFVFSVSTDMCETVVRSSRCYG